MNALKTSLFAASFAFGCAFPPSLLAQGHGHGKHAMVQPADLKWADVPSVPPGAKIASM